MSVNNITYNKGFTIIEVVIALTILSVGILAITNMQMTSYGIYFTSNKLTTATLISQSILEELMSLKFSDPKLVDLTEEGIFTTYVYDAVSSKFLETNYEYDIHKGFDLRWEVDNKSNGTKTINVIATWQGMGEEKELIFPLQRSVQQSIE